MDSDPLKRLLCPFCKFFELCHKPWVDSEHIRLHLYPHVWPGKIVPYSNNWLNILLCLKPMNELYASNDPICAKVVFVRRLANFLNLVLSSSSLHNCCIGRQCRITSLKISVLFWCPENILFFSNLPIIERKNLNVTIIQSWIVLYQTNILQFVSRILIIRRY